jgi:hypothetical protein
VSNLWFQYDECHRLKPTAPSPQPSDHVRIDSATCFQIEAHPMETIINWIVHIVGQWGYVGIVYHMFLESSCSHSQRGRDDPAGYLSSPRYLQSRKIYPATR